MEDKIEIGLNKILNAHGYCFQYAVLKKIIESSLKPNSIWKFEVSEFPVIINNKDIHIDFILKNKTSNFFLICECKRVNPPYQNWIFIKSPYVSNRIKNNEVGREEKIVREVLDLSEWKSYLEHVDKKTDIFRLHHEIKNNNKTDNNNNIKKEDCQKSDEKGQINDALTQVLRGHNGFIEYCFNRNKIGALDLNEKKTIAVLPTIFTSAKIYSSETDISEADLFTGNIERSKIILEEKKWLFFQSNQSQSLKHNYFIKHKLSISSILQNEFSRTIPIVSAEGIDNFLSHEYWEDQSHWVK